MNPANQRILGTFTTATEIAHPFRIEANSVACAFIEFADFYNSSDKKLQPYFESVVDSISGLSPEFIDYHEAFQQYYNSSTYKQLKDALLSECFWEISQYELIITTEYENRKKDFSFTFDVSRETNDDIKYNMEELLKSFLNEKYKIPCRFKPVQVEIKKNQHG
jgi:hypothetical protein